MFDGFARVWTPVIESRRVRNKSVALELAGEKVVLFRGAKGEIGALLDKCPHKGASLSKGIRTPEGCLRCPYHRFEYATDGQCTKITLHPEAKRELMSATALPVRDKAGLIWVYTAPGVEAPSEPVIPAGLIDDRLAHFYLEQEWKCHWARVTENMLDTPHLPFVHRRSVGMPLAQHYKPESRFNVVVEDTAVGCRSRYDIDGFQASNDWLEFTKPNRMSNCTLAEDGRVTREFNIWAVPKTATLTRVIVATSRSFGGKNPLFKIFDHIMSRVILSEDRPIVEAQRPVVPPDPSEERSVAGDAHTLRFRKFYLQEMHHSTVDAPRPKVNRLPVSAVG